MPKRLVPASRTSTTNYRHSVKYYGTGRWTIEEKQIVMEGCYTDKDLVWGILDGNWKEGW